MEIYDDNILT